MRPRLPRGVGQISLYVDIGQGAGLAAASGVRPFLPPLLAGALARGDLGLDFDGTGWRFLEAPGFLLAVLAVAVLSYGAERSRRNRPSFGGSAGAAAAAEAPAEGLEGKGPDPGPDSPGETEGGASGEDTSAREGDVGAADVATAAVERAAGAPKRGPTARRRLELTLVALGALLGALLFAGSLAEGGREAWPGLIAGAACATLAYTSVGSLFERARARLDESGAGLLAVYADGVALAVAAVAVVLPALSFLALGVCALLLVKTRQQRGRKYAGLRILR